MNKKKNGEDQNLKVKQIDTNTRKKNMKKIIQKKNGKNLIKLKNLIQPTQCPKDLSHPWFIFQEQTQIPRHEKMIIFTIMTNTLKTVAFPKEPRAKILFKIIKTNPEGNNVLVLITNTCIFSPDLPRRPPVTAQMKMEEFQNLIQEQEFEGESILEDFDDFGAD